MMFLPLWVWLCFSHFTCKCCHAAGDPKLLSLPELFDAGTPRCWQTSRRRENPLSRLLFPMVVSLPFLLSGWHSQEAAFGRSPAWGPPLPCYLPKLSPSEAHCGYRHLVVTPVPSSSPILKHNCIHRNRLEDTQQNLTVISGWWDDWV